MPSANKPIEGIGTAVAAFVGLAPGGPINTPMRISNWTQFAKIFGDPNNADNGPFMDGAYMAHSVYGFFQNGGTNCWIVRVGQYYYVSNTGSNTLSGYTIAADGQPSLIGTTGVVAATEPGPIDTTSPAGTNFLYAETGSGTVDEFSVNDDGTLTTLGVVDGLPVGIEGIAST